MEDFNTKKGTLVPTLPKRASSDYLNKLQIQPNSGADRTYSIPLFFSTHQPRLKQAQRPHRSQVNRVFCVIVARASTRLLDLQR